MLIKNRSIIKITIKCVLKPKMRLTKTKVFPTQPFIARCFFLVMMEIKPKSSVILSLLFFCLLFLTVQQNLHTRKYTNTLFYTFHKISKKRRESAVRITTAISITRIDILLYLHTSTMFICTYI